MCSNLQGWVNTVLAALFDALKLQSGSGLLGVIVDVWNLAVDLAQSVIQGLIATLGAPVLAAIKIGVAVAGVISIVASFLKPWDVKMTPAPIIDHFAHPGEPDHVGVLTASIDTHGSDAWTGAILDCAAAAGVTLPDPAAAGKPVDWTTKSLAIVEVATIRSAETDTKVRGDDTARLTWVTAHETPEDTQGPEHNGSLFVLMKVQRLTQQDIQAMFDKLVFGGSAGQLLAQLLAPTLASTKAKLAKLMTVTATAVIPIQFHLAEPTPSALPPTISGADCIVGTWTVDPASWSGWIRQVLKAPGNADTVVSVADPTGTAARTYSANHTFVMAYTDFGSEVSVSVTNINDAFITSQWTTLMDGVGSGSYKVTKVTGTDLTVKYVGVPEGVNIKVRTTFKLNGQELPGAPESPIFDLENPSKVLSDTRSYSCHGDTLIENEVSGQFVVWHRAP